MSYLVGVSTEVRSILAYTPYNLRLISEHIGIYNLRLISKPNDYWSKLRLIQLEVQSDIQCLILIQNLMPDLKLFFWLHKAFFLVAQDIFFTCSAVSCWIFFRSCSTLFGYNYCCCINLSLFIIVTNFVFSLGIVDFWL